MDVEESFVSISQKRSFQSAEMSYEIFIFKLKNPTCEEIKFEVNIIFKKNRIIECFFYIFLTKTAELIVIKFSYPS